jgi:hypothetical protein
LRKQRRENRKGFSRPILASATAFLPGQQEDGSERSSILEMNQKYFSLEKKGEGGVTGSGVLKAGYSFYSEEFRLERRAKDEKVPSLVLRYFFGGFEFFVFA